VGHADHIAETSQCYQDRSIFRFLRHYWFLHRAEMDWADETCWRMLGIACTMLVHLVLACNSRKLHFFLVRKNRIAMLHDHRAKLVHEFMYARSTLLIILAVASNQVTQIIWSIPRIASLRLMLVRCGVLKRLALLNNGKS
jgi:hypothetical protein